MNIETRNQAIELHNQAYQIVGKDKNLAYRLLCSAATIDPTLAQAWHFLSNATGDMTMPDAAVAACRRVLELPIGEAPGDLDIALRLKTLAYFGYRLHTAGRTDEALTECRRAIYALEASPDVDVPERAFAYTACSLVLSVIGDIDGSLEYAARGFALAPDDAMIETGYAFALLFAGQYAKGLEHFDARLRYRLHQYLDYPYPRWKGGKIGSLFVAADQGMGDSLSFARFVPHAAKRVERVIFQVQPELVRLLTGAMRPWSNVEVIPQSAMFPAADAWCPTMGLPTALGMSTHAIERCPQGWVMPVDAGVAPVGWKVPGRLAVGVAWAGSPLNDIDRHRSIPVTAFLDLYRVPGVQLYGLQVGDRVADLHAAGAAALIRDMSPWIRDASDTVAIMRGLDLVIACESFVGHLAGAAGVPCWVLVSKLGGDWRCGRTGDRQLWYQRSKVFRQGADASWGPVFDQIVEELGRLLPVEPDR